MTNKFNLENEYQNYLKRCGVVENDINEIQRTETKKAFMAGCGSILLICGNEI